MTKLSPDGRVLLKLGKPGEGAGKKDLDIFDAPTGVVAASNGDIFVAEGHGEANENNSRIMKFSKDGRFIKTFATRGPGDGQLRSPHAIAIDSQDRLFVADRSNSRVVIFDKDGNFIAAWKQFGRPSGIYVDKNDMLYVADSQSSDAPGAANYNPGCRRGIRIGSAEGRTRAVFHRAAGRRQSHVPAADRGCGGPRRRDLSRLRRSDDGPQIRARTERASFEHRHGLTRLPVAKPDRMGA